MGDVNEQQRLTKLYEQLRVKLLDLSKKNPMLNYRLGARSKRHLQIVDEVLEEVYRKLVGEDAALKIAFLQEPEDIPSEERTEDFISVLEHAKVSDIKYLTKLEEQEQAGRDDETTLASIERELRSKVRAQLGLPPRPSRADVNRADHARSLGIDPGPELQPERSKPSHDETVTKRPELMLEFTLQPGEAYFINNYTILHARTAFDDGDAPEDARRHLLRLWLDAPIRPVHPYVRSRGILPVAGRTPSFDWSSITAVRH
jgi:hypothetical protein